MKRLAFIVGGFAVLVGCVGNGNDSSTSDAASDQVVAADNAVPDAAVCSTGDQQCSATGVPQTCADGAWQDEAPCGGLTPVCSNGICAAYRNTGGIRSTTPTAATADGGILLVSGGFELGTRTCGQSGICVTGGIVP